MSDQPLYHLRPNKYVDRCLFVEALLKLNRCFDLSTYQYVGFGSYSFDDFKAIHCKLGISKMISLEADERVAARAGYNKPYRCIHIKPEFSSDCLDELLACGSNQVIWFDYTSPSDIYNQFSDAVTLLRRSQVGDVLRFTFNANPAALGVAKTDVPEDELRKSRRDKLRERLGEYFDPDILAEDMIPRAYPRVLRDTLHYALTREIGVPNPYDTRRILPLFSTIYCDGQQMLTMTFVIADKEKEGEINEVFNDWAIPCLEWEAEERIQIPYLTEREFWDVIRLLPAEDGAQSLRDQFPFIYETLQDAESFVKHYKSYPRFHNIEI